MVSAPQQSLRNDRYVRYDTWPPSHHRRIPVRLLQQNPPRLRLRAIILEAQGGRHQFGKVQAMYCNGRFLAAPGPLRNGVSVGSAAVERLRNRVYPRTPRFLNARNQLYVAQNLSATSLRNLPF